MKCPNCQTENLAAGKFCRECGVRLLMICDKCGYENPPDGKFCNACAWPLPSGFELEDARSKIESERKNVTALFSDFSQYTRLTERLDPEEVKEIIHQIFSNVTGVIKKYEGFVERVFGDEVLAYFGVPRSCEDHPLRAILAAREIHELVNHMSLEYEDKAGQTLSMHTGINTGLVVTGTTDVTRGHDGFSGQMINVASRLADLAGPDEILVGPDTFHKTESHFIFEPITLEPADFGNEKATVYRLTGMRSKRMFDLGPEHKLTPFVGRLRELGRLQNLLEKAQQGLPQAVSIVSRPGGGKSRLLHEFRNTISDKNISFLEGKCYSFHSNTAYYPIISLLRRRFDILEFDDNSVITQKIKKGFQSAGLRDASSIPYLLQLLSVKDNITTKFQQNLEELRDRLTDFVKQMVTRSSEEQTTVIAIEDLHWIDMSSEQYLEELVRGLPDAKVLLILTHRSEYLPPWKDMRQISRIELKQFAKQHSLAMTKNLLGTKRLGSDLEGLILDKAGGVP